jgi:hypothetical protein
MVHKAFGPRATLNLRVNYKRIVADATHYFPLFFHFSKLAHEYVAQHDVWYRGIFSQRSL